MHDYNASFISVLETLVCNLTNNENSRGTVDYGNYLYRFKLKTFIT